MTAIAKNARAVVAAAVAVANARPLFIAR